MEKMAANNFVDLFRTLESYGLTDALLPFLLIFTILFAMLQKTKILGAGKKNFNVMVAFIIAALVVIPHITGSYPGRYDLVEILNKALPEVSIVVVAVVMALLLLGLLGGEAKWMGGSLTGGIAIAAFAGIIYIFGGAAGWWNNIMFNWFAQDTITLVIVILVFAIVIWYVTKEDTPADAAAKTKGLLDEVGKLFGGGGGGHH
ncbi:hypothetical protein HZC31_03875 [Candidatus Woesearchaeota archaeon]|nr:hypothetical protein [Candidatus Woesearchaeota archaeon]